LNNDLNQYAATTTVHKNGSTHAIAEQWFGRRLKPADYISLTGSLPGAHIRVETQERQLHIHVEHPHYELHRIVQRKNDETLVIHNESFYLKDGVPRGTGIATRVFARQVDGAYRMGITKISTLAAGDAREIHRDPDALSGWYVWARLGYNARVPGHIAELLQRVPSSSPLHRLLFDTPGGADFWRALGEGFHGTFDPRPDSPHRRRLDRVCYEKGIDPYAD
jgi:hypothetical protein